MCIVPGEWEVDPPPCNLVPLTPNGLGIAFGGDTTTIINRDMGGM